MTISAGNGYDPGPNQYGEDFGGREPVTSCQTCGTKLAVLSPREWVDRANNKAASTPVWHDHTPSDAQERIHA